MQKKLDVGLLVMMIWRLIATVVAAAFIIFISNWIHNGDTQVTTYPGITGKRPLKVCLKLTDKMNDV